MSAAAIHANTGRGGHREMSPPSSLLLLLVALTVCLAGTVFCKDKIDPEESNDAEGLENIGETSTTSPTPVPDTSRDVSSSGENSENEDVSMTTSDVIEDLEEHDDSRLKTEFSHDASGSDNNSSSGAVDEELSPIFILVPVALGVLIIAMIVGGVIINRRWNKKNKSHSDQDQHHEDDYLHGSDTEKVPMPMFEDDVPSVLELEMEDLEDWMNKDKPSRLLTSPVGLWSLHRGYGVLGGQFSLTTGPVLYCTACDKGPSPIAGMDVPLLRQRRGSHCACVKGQNNVPDEWVD
ncbi:hypothetical protein DPEC_G00182450 [Dallia pectoralis]|uniref:Uncharacterized protein n=1 Tax=Dallia pectoralis TaxID=75939 RepID=A0ACC2GAY7_DALPE|nr:hypothetical protein DPEC_G00182450 [Dallia pectoralis]